jgi:hypothetical protein
MTVDGEVEEEEVKVGKGAAKGTGNGQGKVLPSVSNSRALSQEVENILGGRPTLRADRGGSKAKAVSPGLKGQTIVDSRKTCIHQQGREASCSHHCTIGSHGKLFQKLVLNNILC